MAKALYKTDLSEGAVWRGQTVSGGGLVELDILSEDKEGETLNLGISKTDKAEETLLVGKCKKGTDVGQCFVPGHEPAKRVHHQTDTRK